MLLRLHNSLGAYLEPSSIARHCEVCPVPHSRWLATVKQSRWPSDELQVPQLWSNFWCHVCIFRFFLHFQASFSSAKHPDATWCEYQDQQSMHPLESRQHLWILKQDALPRFIMEGCKYVFDASAGDEETSSLKLWIDQKSLKALFCRSTPNPQHVR
jgi:hypothetical protein